jgi:hypothetical protein
VQALLVERGFRVERLQPRSEFDDLHISGQSVWRTRPARVRVVYRPLTDDDVQELASVARQEALSDAVLIEAASTTTGPPPAVGAVQVIGAAELIARLQQSSLLAWSDGRPAADIQRYSVWRELNERALALDPVGLRWLPALALDKIPSELEETGRSADELFERYAFRLFTSLFRFGGERLGAARRGQREPDARLVQPGCTAGRSSVLLDCKARRDGFVMSASDERALLEYCVSAADELRATGHPLSHLVVLSSWFPGQEGARHPFHARAQKFASEGVQLTYLRAGDLVQLGVQVEAQEDSPARRETYRWDAVFDRGMPDLAALLMAHRDLS